MNTGQPSQNACGGEDCNKKQKLTYTPGSHLYSYIKIQDLCINNKLFNA